jgi:hypothetical protein
VLATLDADSGGALDDLPRLRAVHFEHTSPIRSAFWLPALEGSVSGSHSHAVSAVENRGVQRVNPRTRSG